MKVHHISVVAVLLVAFIASIASAQEMQSMSAEEELDMLLSMTVDDMVTQGSKLRQDGRLLEAYGLLDLATREEPRNAKAWIELGRLHLQTLDPEQAVAAILIAKDIDSHHQDLHHLLGQGYAQGKKHKKAVAEFRTSIEKGNASAQVYFDLGISQIQLKDWDGATQSYNKVIDAAPNEYISRAHYNLSLIAMQQDDQAAAASHMQAAVDSEPNAETRAAYESQLQSLQAEGASAKEQGQQIMSLREELQETSTSQLNRLMRVSDSEKKWIWGTLTLSLEHDDNVTLIENVSGLPAAGGIKDDDDWRFVANLYLETQFLEKDNWTFGSRFGLYQSKHFNEESVDFGSISASPYLRYKGDNWLAEIDFTASYSQLGGSGYESYLGGGLTFVWQQCDNAALRTYYRYAARQVYPFSRSAVPVPFTSDVRDRDGYLNTVGIVQSMWNDDRSVQGYVGFNARVQETEGNDYDGVMFTFLTGISIQLPMDIRMNLSYSYTLEDYTNINSTGATGFERADDRHSAAIRLVKTITEDIDIFAEYRYSTNDSNITSFKYESNVVALGMMYRF